MYQTNTEFKEFFASVLGNLPYGVITIDLEGKISLANSNAITYLGLKKTPDEILDQDLLNLVRHIPPLKKHIHESISVSRQPFSLNKVDAEPLFLNIKGQKMLNGMLLTIENITREVQYQNALIKSNKELEEFAFVSAHDIKSHFTSLSGLVGLLDEEGAVKDEYHDIFQRLKDCVEIVGDKIRAVNEIIEFNRDLSQKPKRIKLDDELKSVLAELSHLIEEYQANIKLDVDGSMYVKFPQSHLRTLLIELISNGIKFSRKNKSPEIEIKCYTEKDFSILVIKDSGRGFAVEQNEQKLFGLFQKLNTDVPGTGVGLYMVNEIIKTHGGKIKVKSKPNEGTTFKIHLKNG